MLPYPREHIRRQIGNLILALLGLAVLGALWGTWVRIEESVQTGREDVREAGTRIAAELDHELDVYVSNLRAMKYLSERFLSGRAQGTENPITRLVPVPGRDGYESVLPPAFGDLSTLGRITGAGPVPALDDPVKHEMVMAVGLTPLMRAARERSVSVPWVQYASARNFMFIFPHKGSEQFHFTADLKTRDYYARATPEVNPRREIFWSNPYEDAAGQGTIVTVTQPVYHADQFLGSVSIDFKVESLTRFLTRTPIPKTHVHVVAGDGQKIVQAWAHEDQIHIDPKDRITVPLKNAPWQVELLIDDGELLASALRGRMWHLGAAAVLVVTFVFLVLLVRSHRRVRDLAITDGLTGLYNRRHFDLVARQQFELVKRNRLRLALAIMDVDFFKKYNDHYGHQQGDVALKAVAQALRKGLRRGADQVFRVGGEEFAVMVMLQADEAVEPLLEKLNQAVRDIRMPHVQNPPGYVTASIGATVVCQIQWLDVDAAYKRADEALYAAKSGGRDRAVCLPAVAEEAKKVESVDPVVGRVGLEPTTKGL